MTTSVYVSVRLDCYRPGMGRDRTRKRGGAKVKAKLFLTMIIQSKLMCAQLL